MEKKVAYRAPMDEERKRILLEISLGIQREETMRAVTRRLGLDQATHKELCRYFQKNNLLPKVGQRKKKPLNDKITVSRMITEHYEWANELMRRTARKTRIHEDEAFADGLNGLIRAAELWDGKRSFKTYAAIKVFGAIIDGYRARYGQGHRKKRGTTAKNPVRIASLNEEINHKNSGSGLPIKRIDNIQAPENRSEETEKFDAKKIREFWRSAIGLFRSGAVRERDFLIYVLAKHGLVHGQINHLLEIDLSGPRHGQIKKEVHGQMQPSEN